MTSAGAPRIALLTHFPSPYQVELFNEIERQRPGKQPKGHDKGGPH